ncbi:MAG: hypothetical protein ACFFBP_20810 [Promethearchaeota archaeon]
MNQNNPNFKDQELNKTSSINTEEKAEKRMTEKINLLSSEQINQFINKLSSPGFLGSIHLKKETGQNPSLVKSLLYKNLETNLTKSLKNPLNYPVTRFLILLMILFNILWILFFYIL